MRWLNDHQLNEHESEQAPGVGDGQGSPVCCSPWGCKESDVTERLNWTELNYWMKRHFLSSPKILPFFSLANLYYQKIVHNYYYFNLINQKFMETCFFSYHISTYVISSTSPSDLQSLNFPLIKRRETTLAQKSWW